MSIDDAAGTPDPVCSTFESQADPPRGRRSRPWQTSIEQHRLTPGSGRFIALLGCAERNAPAPSRAAMHSELVGNLLGRSTSMDLPEGFTPPKPDRRGFVPARGRSTQSRSRRDVEHRWRSTRVPFDFDDDPDPGAIPSLERTCPIRSAAAQDFHDRVGSHTRSRSCRTATGLGCVLPSIHAPRRWWRRVGRGAPNPRYPDEPLRRAVRAWLDGTDWPFERIDFAAG